MFIRDERLVSKTSEYGGFRRRSNMSWGVAFCSFVGMKSSGAMKMTLVSLLITTKCF